MSIDTVFNGEMRVVFCDDSHVVLRRLKAGHPESWSRVCIGETNKIVSIPEYLHGEMLADVQKLIKDVLRKQALPVYKRDPSRLDTYIQQTALRIIDLVQKEK